MDVVVYLVSLTDILRFCTLITSEATTPISLYDAMRSIHTGLSNGIFYHA